MKNLLLLLLLAGLSFNVMADNTTGGGDGDIDDMFAGGTDEFEFERFSDDRILVAIDADAAINCSSEGLCTLAATTTNNRGFTVSFNVGEGGSQNGLGGYGNGNGGTTINVGGDNSSDNNEVQWGVNIRYSIGTCTQKVKVPRALFYAINRYMYGLMNSDGSVRRGFTPADEAMILFYTTILNKAAGCGGE